MNLNCYNYTPKEERKNIQDFIDEMDFMTSELSNMYKLKVYKMNETHPDEVTDMERAHLALLEHIIDGADELAHDLRTYKENIV